MPRYRVIARVVEAREYIVEADNEEQAKERCWDEPEVNVERLGDYDNIVSVEEIKGSVLRNTDYSEKEMGA